MNHMSEAGKLIIIYASNKHITLPELAKKLGISQSHLSNILHGIRNIDNSLHTKLCTVFELDKTERAKLKEACWVSNNVITINTKKCKPGILKIVYLAIHRARYLNQDQIEQCINILSSVDGKN